MPKKEIIQKIILATKILDGLSLDIAEEKGADNNQEGLLWDSVYRQAIRLNETANRVKIQVKLKTR